MLRFIESRQTSSQIVDDRASATGHNEPQIAPETPESTTSEAVRYHAGYSSAIPAQNLSTAAVPQAVAAWLASRAAPVISPGLRVVSAVFAAAPLLGNVLSASKPSAAARRETKIRTHDVRAREVEAQQLPDTRRLLQLGLVFAMAYLVFLIFWFWATRARRGGARDVRL